MRFFPTYLVSWTVKIPQQTLIMLMARLMIHCDAIWRTLSRVEDAAKGLLQRMTT